MLTFSRYTFAPGLLSSIVVLLALSLLINLGLWQLRRAEQKQAEIDAITSFQTEIAEAQPSYKAYVNLALAGQRGLDEAPIKLAGRFHSKKPTVLYDNRVYQRQVGYQVLSLLLPNNSSRGVLINRGWIPLPEMRRDIMPTLSTPAGDQIITGKLWLPNENLVTFGDEIIRQNGDFLIAQKVDLGLLEQHFGVQLAPFVIKLENVIELETVTNLETTVNKAEKGLGAYSGQISADHFVLDWPPTTSIGTSPQKHIGYAIQWFAMAFAAALVFVFASTRASNRGQEQP